MIKTKWWCDICNDVCEKRPFFKFYQFGKKNALGPGKSGTKDEGEWKCSSCGHAPKNHTFTFKESKKEEQKIGIG